MESPYILFDVWLPSLHIFLCDSSIVEYTYLLIVYSYYFFVLQHKDMPPFMHFYCQWTFIYYDRCLYTYSIIHILVTIIFIAVEHLGVEFLGYSIGNVYVQFYWLLPQFSTDAPIYTPTHCVQVALYIQYLFHVFSFW